MPTQVVSQQDWLIARKALLAEEKNLTRVRDALSARRRELPWVKIEKEYQFEGPDSQVALSALFGGRSQLIVYHFMYGQDWDQGCKSCSFWADNFNDIIVHLNQRDVSMVAVSTARVATLLNFQKRMGWNFTWVSSGGTSFNQDFGVSPEPFAPLEYNYGTAIKNMDELPGISVFAKDAEGSIYHTYSCYSRGLDMLNGAYHFLDLVPKGRGEDGLPHTMSWLKHHDSY